MAALLLGGLSWTHVATHAAVPPSSEAVRTHGARHKLATERAWGPSVAPLQAVTGTPYFPKAPPRSLTTSDKIRQCISVEDLKSLVLGFRQTLTPAELAHVFSHLSHLHASGPPTTTSRRLRARTHAAAFAVRLLGTHGGQLQAMEAGGLGQVLSALACLQCRLSPEWLSDYLSTSMSLMPTSTPRQLSLELRALSHVLGYNAALWECRQVLVWLKMFMGMSELLLSRFAPDDLSITITAVCDLASTPYRPPSTWMLQYAQAARSHLRSFESRQLAQVLAAFARLQFKPNREWAAAFQKQVQLKLALFDASDLAILLASVADGRPMILLEAAVVQDLVGEAVRKLPTFKLSPLSRLLYALAVLEQPVEGALLDKALHRLQASLPKARPCVLSDICWSLPTLGHLPAPSFLQALEAATLQKLRMFKRAELVALITGMALLRWRPGWEWMEGVAHHALGSCPALKHRTGVLHALAGLGCPGTPGVVRLVADSVSMADGLPELKGLTAVQQVQLLWGTAHLAPSHLPHSWLHKWCLASRRQFSNLTPALWCDILQALARVSFRPDTEWLTTAVVCLQASFPEMLPWELASCVTGLAGVGYSSSRRWALDLQAAAHEQLHEFSLEELVQLGWGLAQMRQPLTPDLQQHWLHCVVPAVMLPSQEMVRERGTEREENGEERPQGITEKGGAEGANLQDLMEGEEDLQGLTARGQGEWELMQRGVEQERAEEGMAGGATVELEKPARGRGKVHGQELQGQTGGVAVREAGQVWERQVGQVWERADVRQGPSREVGQSATTATGQDHMQELGREAEVGEARVGTQPPVVPRETGWQEREAARAELRVQASDLEGIATTHEADARAIGVVAQSLKESGLQPESGGSSPACIDQPASLHGTQTSPLSLLSPPPSAASASLPSAASISLSPTPTPSASLPSSPSFSSVPPPAQSPPATQPSIPGMLLQPDATDTGPSTPPTVSVEHWLLQQRCAEALALWQTGP